MRSYQTGGWGDPTTSFTKAWAMVCRTPAVSDTMRWCAFETLRVLDARHREKKVVGMICDLCGREFSESQGRTSCSSCGFWKGCEGVRCPYCYYEMVPRPKWVEGLFTFFNRGRRQSKQNRTESLPQDWGIPLTLLNANTRAKITHLRTQDRHRLRKIIAMGALPETEITLLQKFPSFVFQIGFSQFSIDKELTSCIYVRPYSNEKIVDSNGSGVATIE